MATPYVVSSLADSGPGTLRETILLINSSSNTLSSITFSVGGTIILASNLPQINRHFTLDGNKTITIDGDNTYSLLNINVNMIGTSTISGIRFVNGLANNNCAGIAVTNTTIDLIDVNITECSSYYTNSTSYGTALFGDNSIINISALDNMFGNYSNNRIYFETDFMGGIIRMIDSTLTINYGTRIFSNSCAITSSETFIIDGSLIAQTNGQLQIISTSISFNEIPTTTSYINSLIYYDSNSNAQLNNVTFDTNGNSNTPLINCISIPLSSISVEMDNITATNMPCKFIYAPNVRLLMFGPMNINNLKSIAIINSLQVNNFTSYTFSDISDDNINGCLGFEIRLSAPNGLLNMSFNNFTSISPTCISSAFYIAPSGMPASEFIGCTFTNMNTINQVIKYDEAITDLFINVRNCYFSGCSSQSNGSTISVDNTGAILTLTNTNFDNCTSTGNGGAIYLSSNCQLNAMADLTSQFNYCNSTNNGGAIYLSNSNTILHTITNITFIGCTTNGSGGAIYNGALLNISGCEFNNCIASNGGAIYYDNSNTFEQRIISSNFTSNTAHTNGGSLYISNNSTLTIGEELTPNNVSFSYGNSMYGAAIYLIDGSRILYLVASFLSNSARENGGALFINTIEPLIFTDSRLTMENNSATFSGGNIHIDPQSNVSISNATLNNSTSNRGGNIFNAGILTLTNCTLTDNNSSSCLETDSYSTTTITRCNLSSSTTTLILSGMSIISLSSITSSDIGIIELGSCNISQCSIFNCVTGINNLSGALNLDNSTINNCTYCISYESTDQANLINNTMIGINGIACRVGSNKITAVNNIISNVNAQNINQIESLGNNIITNNSGLAYFTQPTDINNTNPILSPFQDNGGPTLSYIPLDGSPAINGGNTLYATEFDQRGPGYPRTINDLIDIGSIESADPPICFTNDSQIQVTTNKNPTNINPEYINIIDLINSNPTKIYTIHGANKIEVTKIISTIAPKTLIQINAQTNPNQFNPFQPTHFTGGHTLIQNNNVHIKARDIPNKTIIQNTNYTNVYSLVTEITATLKVNNINTLTLSEDKLERLKLKGTKPTVVWSNK